MEAVKDALAGIYDNIDALYSIASKDLAAINGKQLKPAVDAINRLYEQTRESA